MLIHDSEIGGAWEVLEHRERPRLSFVKDIIVERGVLADWRILEGLHYKGHGTLTPGSHYYKMTLYGEVIGVLMMASPKMLCKERHVLFPKLKPGRDTRITNTARMKWINANMAIVARVVINTNFRGAGLAYRFTNLAARMEGKRYVELMSTMSRYNLFAQKAGFVFTPPMKANAYNVGIKWFRGTFESNPADTEAILNEIGRLTPASQGATIESMRKFYRKNSMLENTGKGLIETDGIKFGDSRVARLPVRELLTQIQQLVLASPLYGVYENPDVGIKLPDALAILTFDNQLPTEPFNFDILSE